MGNFAGNKLKIAARCIEQQRLELNGRKIINGMAECEDHGPFFILKYPP
jgi:hypothetical protein